MKDNTQAFYASWSGVGSVVCETFIKSDSVIHRVDPRVRILAAVAFSVLMALSRQPAVLFAGLGAGLALMVLAGLPVRPLGKRFAAVNAFVALLAVVLPLSTPGVGLFRMGPLNFSREGLIRACLIGLRANGIVVMLTALVSTIELPRLGRALHSLGLPRKLTHLFFFTVRYIDVLHHEYHRLRCAMRVRCFTPGMNAHTYRSLGYLVGMLLVKSFDRSERVLAAMKCRGFSGEFHVMKRLELRRRDVLIGLAFSLLFVHLLLIELL